MLDPRWFLEWHEPVRRYGDRVTLRWLAAAIATPFIANFGLPPASEAESQLAGIVRVVLVVLLPLALLAVEARISERRKTFAFIIMAMIAIVGSQLWATKDLLTFAWVFLGGSGVMAAAIVARRMLSAPARAAIGEGAR